MLEDAPTRALGTVVGIFALAPYEIGLLAVGGLALLMSVIALVVGFDNRKDIKTIVRKQDERAGQLVEDLQHDLDGGGG